MTNRGTTDTDGKVGVTGGDGGEISAVGMGSNEGGEVMPPPPESIGSIVSFDEEYGKKGTKRSSLPLSFCFKRGSICVWMCNLSV